MAQAMQAKMGMVRRPTKLLAASVLLCTSFLATATAGAAQHPAATTRQDRVPPQTISVDNTPPTTDTGSGANSTGSPPRIGATGEAVPEVSRIRTWNADTYTRIVIDVGARVKYQAKRIDGPDRVYFDLQGARVGSGLSRKSIDLPSGGFLKAIRVAQNQSDIARLVFELNRVKDYSVVLLSNPYRLVVNVYGPGGAPAADQQAMERNGAPPSPGSTTTEAASPAKDTEPPTAAVEKGKLAAQTTTGKPSVPPHPAPTARPDRIPPQTISTDSIPPATDTGSEAVPADRSTPEVSRIRTWNADTYTRIVVDVGAPVKYQAKRIDGPDRIYFDLQGARVGSGLSRKSIDLPSGGFLKAIRVAQNQSDIARLVFELNRVKDYSVVLLSNPYRLVVVVYGLAGAPAADQQATARNAAPPSPGSITAEAASPAKGTEPPTAAAEKSASQPETARKAAPPSPASTTAEPASPAKDTQPPTAAVEKSATEREPAAPDQTSPTQPQSTTASTPSDGQAADVGAAPKKMGRGTGALKGTVEDPAGSAVIGAQVALKQNSTGKKFQGSTDEDGYFEVGQLPAGEYIVTVDAPGFESWEKMIEVGAKPAGVILIRMKIPKFTQQVTVTADAESVPSPSALDNTDYLQLDQTSLEHMPIKEGDPLAIPTLFLEPAVLGSQGPQLIVDGVEESTLELPTSAIKEISVNRTPYSAEFARPGNGRIEVTTREGSRHHYRGSVSFILRNSALDARNAFAATRPLMQRPIGEAQLSGPLSQGTTFFVAGRYIHRNQAAIVDARVPCVGCPNPNDGTPLFENFPVHGVDAHLFGRLDFRVSPRNHLTVSYKYKDKARQNQTVGGFDLPSRATNTLDRENEVRVFETATVSERFVNDVQFTYKTQSNSTASLSSDPAIIVGDFFSSGGAQQSRAQTEQVGVVQDIATAVKGRNTVRFGIAARPRSFKAFDATNVGGTYWFSSLSAYNASTMGLCSQLHPDSCPYRFAQNQGNPNVSYHQTEYSAFIQDETRLGPSVSLSLGARYELQSNLAYYRNVAPRAGLAFAPGKGETVIRAGAGLFYDRLPSVMEEQSILYDGVNGLQVVIPKPASYPVPPGQQFTPSVVHIAPDIRTPALFQANLSIDRKLGKGRNYLTLDYTYIKGFRLYRTRDINAPIPPTFSQRPNPNFLNIDQFESSGASKSNILTTTLKASPRPRFDLMVQYTFSHTIDDTSGMFSMPANNYDLRPERGRSDLDRRHRVNLMANYGLPLSFRFGTVVVLNSGIPYNITTGKDDDNDTVANDRQPGISRNTGRGPGFAQVDVHLSRPFHLQRNKLRPRFDLGVDVFNVLNTVNFKNYIGTMTSPFFGYANAANSPREIQLTLQLYF